ncbi:MAG: RagB/SusD family nutrient uptake outer membrane protein [Algibacter sp.]|uniref:RagB/SusD family nutrient uptake outer membrane protein n=1 Tax=Algibacter sp. TaxID=1872428 RepID=UPI002610CCF5|nr:RagB/SusD family nutrient uptake outer membrane protein [Algibacter sp.]MDG1729152.1 RagB/SusD family nutrient uptake outer membrane protein [Algibacter sp.]MDG2178409.1 RagB/SusD family nutrient uptake outer membrane protein [Algibacter sp.]
MKKIIFAISIALTLTNCSNDFIDKASLTQIAENNFWTSESDAFLALNAVYSTLQSRSMYGGNLNGFQGFPGFDGLGDNAFNNFKWEGPGNFMEGNVDPTNGPIENIWNNLYQGISRVNSVIKNVNEISEELIPLETKNELLGQAYFLRALLYFNVSVYFEDAPLITAPQTLQEAFVSKNSYAEITEQVREDLKLAVDFLPPSQPNDLYGYATKGAALGLLARVQLYNKQYDGEFGVLALTEQAMGLGYSLHPNYAELFTPENEKSNEVVFSIRFLRGDDTSNGETFSGTFNGFPKGDLRPMPNLANDYYCIDGLPISSSPLYNASNKGANRDPRATATIYYGGEVYLTEPLRIFQGNGPTRFGTKKYIRTGPDSEGNAVFGEGSQDFYVIRYADILLMRAEAMAETGNVSGASALVTEVRNRVGMPSVEDVEGDVNQPEMIAIVRHERRVEFAMEGLRFMDLKRWGTIEEAFNRAIADPVGPYNPQYRGGKSEVFPIPQSEIDVNTKLIQHPDWI